MTTDSRRFTRTARLSHEEPELDLPLRADPRLEPARSALLDAGWLVVHEKGTFHAYDDLLKDAPRYCCHRSRLESDPRGRRALEASRSYRLAMRATIHASERDKVVACLLPPGVVVGNSALVERDPDQRPVRNALVALAVANSRVVNAIARLRLGTNLNQFILSALPGPRFDEREMELLAVGALALSARHRAYAPLWTELTGKPWDLEAIPGGQARLHLRAMLEALVAIAAGLDERSWRTVLDLTIEGGARSEVGRSLLDAFVGMKGGEGGKIGRGWSSFITSDR